MPSVVFHMCTRLLPGTHELLPADALRGLDPDGYAREMAKYEVSPERKRLRDTVIPGMGRRWTGVVFLSPIHPHAIWQLWLRLTGQRLRPATFWQIPAQSLPRGCVVLDRHLSRSGDPIDPREITGFDARALRTQFRTTSENAAWLRSLAERGRSGAWFNRTPHVLSPEPVDLSEADVISWDEPPDAKT